MVQLASPLLGHGAIWAATVPVDARVVGRGVLQSKALGWAAARPLTQTEKLERPPPTSSAATPIALATALDAFAEHRSVWLGERRRRWVEDRRREVVGRAPRARRGTCLSWASVDAFEFDEERLELVDEAKGANVLAAARPRPARRRADPAERPDRGSGRPAGRGRDRHRFERAARRRRDRYRPDWCLRRLPLSISFWRRISAPPGWPQVFSELNSRRGCGAVDDAVDAAARQHRVAHLIDVARRARRCSAPGPERTALTATTADSLALPGPSQRPAIGHPFPSRPRFGAFTSDLDRLAVACTHG